MMSRFARPGLRPAATRRRVAPLVPLAVLLASLGPIAAVGMAASVSPEHPTGHPRCSDYGYSRALKIDTGTLENRTYVWNEGSPVQSVWAGQSITISNLSGDGQTFDYSATLPIYAVIVKAGSENNAVYHYSPPVLADSSLTRGAGEPAIAHVTFCGQSHPESPSTSPSTSPSGSGQPASGSPSTSPSTSPSGSGQPASGSPSTSPSTSPSGSGQPASGSPSTSPTGSVGGIVGTPRITLPPTDVLVEGRGPAPAGFGAALAAVWLVTLGASLAVLRARRR